MLKKIIIYIVLLGLGACSKYEAGYSSQMMQLPTELNLTDVCFINQDTGFVSGGNIFGGGVFLRTYDGGVSWDTIETQKGINSLDYTNGQLTFLESGNRLHQSYDFDTWSSSLALGWWAWQKHIKLNNGKTILVGGENFGRGFVHRLSYNQPTIALTDTFEHQLEDITFVNNKLYVVGYGIGLRSTDQGDSWQVMPLVGDFFRGIDFPSNQIGYVVGAYGSVFKTTNAGNEWKEVRMGNSLLADDNRSWNDLAFVDDNWGFLVGTGNMVWQTTDGGKSWQEIGDLSGWASFSTIRIAHNKAYIAGDKGKLLIINL